MKLITEIFLCQFCWWQKKKFKRIINYTNLEKKSWNNNNRKKNKDKLTFRILRRKIKKKFFLRKMPLFWTDAIRINIASASFWDDFWATKLCQLGFFLCIRITKIAKLCISLFLFLALLTLRILLWTVIDEK